MRRVLSVCSLVISGIVLILFAVNVWSIILDPFPIEYREGHSLSSTFLLLKGLIPFQLDQYPEYYNSYGIVFNIFVYPFALIFGNTLVLNRVINEIFWILIACLIVFYKNKSIKVSSLVVFCTTYILFHYNTNLSVRPDGLGTLLFVLTVLIPFRNQYNIKSIIISAICSLLAFYTKPYFILGWYIMNVMFLFESYNWKKIIVYNIIFHICLLVSTVLIFLLMPLYFYETIFAYSSSIGDIYYSWLQLKWTIKDSLPILLLCLPCVLYLIASKQLRIVAIGCFTIVLLLLYPLGTNAGATQTYHGQLLIPIMSLLAIETIKQINKYEIYLSLLSSILLINTYFRMHFTESYNNDNSWVKLCELIDSNENILNSPVIAPIMMEKNKKIYDDGVSGFVYEYEPKDFTTCVFGLDSLILEKKHKYISSIETQIDKGLFDCIILTENDIWLTRIKNDKYILSDSIELYMPIGQQWKLRVYERTNE